MDWNKLAEEYKKQASNRKADAYEFEINNPSLFKMFPEDTTNKTFLDIGAGSGDLIKEWKDIFEEKNIYLSDYSEKMCAFLKDKHISQNVFQWDIEEPAPIDKQFDIVFSKLVLMFVNDLEKAALNISKVVNKDGVLIISVIHPTYWYSEFLKGENSEFDVMKNGYFSTGVLIPKPIGGNKKLITNFIHRTLVDYISPFLNHGFLLDKIDEPRLTEEFVEENPRFSNRLDTPMRLNLRFRKI